MHRQTCGCDQFCRLKSEEVHPTMMKSCDIPFGNGSSKSHNRPNCMLDTLRPSSTYHPVPLMAWLQHHLGCCESHLVDKWNMPSSEKNWEAEGSKSPRSLHWFWWMFRCLKNGSQTDRLRLVISFFFMSNRPNRVSFPNIGPGHSTSTWPHSTWRLLACDGCWGETLPLGPQKLLLEMNICRCKWNPRI